MYYDNGEMVNFQVIEEEWHDQTPLGPTKPGHDSDKKVSPYSIKATMRNDGLGICLWWAT